MGAGVRVDITHEQQGGDAEGALVGKGSRGVVCMWGGVGRGGVGVRPRVSIVVSISKGWGRGEDGWVCGVWVDGCQQQWT